MASTIIEFGILDSSRTPGQKTWLAFELLPGYFPEQWAAAFAYEFSRKSIRHISFGALFVDELYYRGKISSMVRKLNEAADSKIGFTVKESEIVPFIKRTVLEAILCECTQLQTRGQELGLPRSRIKIADELADFTRAYLQIYHPEYHFQINLQAYSPQTYWLPEEAIPLFTCDRHDGWLYLDTPGEGQDSLAAFNERSAAIHQPQTLFSGNSQILYRDNFDGKDLQAKAREWLNSQNQTSDRVGLIPLAKPLHSYSRNQVRDLFSKTKTTLDIRVSRDGKTMTLGELYDSLRPIRSRTAAYFPLGVLQAATQKFLRSTYLDIPVNLYGDCYHRHGGPFWMFKWTYYRLRPRVFQFYFATSWPLRKIFYFLEFQFRKRLLGTEKKPKDAIKN